MFIILVLLLAFYLLTQDSEHLIKSRFDLNAEANLPTWFSTALLLGISFSAFSLYALKSHSPQRYFWLVFGFFYSFLSMDEAAMIHETVGKLTGVKWVYLYLPLTGAFFLFAAYHLFRGGDMQLRNRILSGLLIYGIGGLVGELVAHLLPLTPEQYRIEILFEEGLEMSGSILVLAGCLIMLDKGWQGFRRLDD